jgi:hypothetical protein
MTAGFHPPPDHPLQTILVGQGWLGVAPSNSCWQHLARRLISAPPMQSLSPFGGSPQWQKQAKPSSGERLNNRNLIEKGLHCRLYKTIDVRRSVSTNSSPKHLSCLRMNVSSVNASFWEWIQLYKFRKKGLDLV